MLAMSSAGVPSPPSSPRSKLSLPQKRSCFSSRVFYARAGEAKVTAAPGETGACPLCREEVRAKCGNWVAWHWAHVGGARDCDPWSEPETPWHRWWKLCAPDQNWCEVTVGQHRADIRIPNKGVVELQHSPISAEDIRTRERFYGKMVWVLDARSYTLPSAIELKRLERIDRSTWRWRWPRRTFLDAKKCVLFDLGDQVLQAKRIRDSAYVTIEGQMLPRDQVLQRLGLRPPPTSNANEVVSYMVEWEVPQNERAEHGWPKEPRGPRYLTRRREFFAREHLDRWIQRHGASFTAYSWMASGALTTLDLAHRRARGSSSRTPARHGRP